MNDYNTCYLCCSICGEKFPLFDVQYMTDPVDNSEYRRLFALSFDGYEPRNVKLQLFEFIRKHLHKGEQIENDLGTGLYLLHECMTDVYNECSRSRAFYSLPFTEERIEENER